MGIIPHKPNRTKFRRKYSTDQAIKRQLDNRPGVSDQHWQAGNQLLGITLPPTQHHQKLASSPSYSRFHLPTIRHWSPEPLHTAPDTIFSPTSDSIRPPVAVLAPSPSPSTARTKQPVPLRPTPPGPTLTATCPTFRPPSTQLPPPFYTLCCVELESATVKGSHTLPTRILLFTAARSNASVIATTSSTSAWCMR